MSNKHSYSVIDGLNIPRNDTIHRALGILKCQNIAADAVSFSFILRRSEFLTLNGLRHFKLQNKIVLAEIKSKAGNIIVENISMRIGFLLSGVIVSMLSPNQTAVYFVAMILTNFTFSFGDGLQNAVIAICGRCVGAKDFSTFQNYTKLFNLTGIVLSITIGLIYTLGAETFFGFFFKDDVLLELGAKTAVIVAIISLFQIVRFVNVAIMRSLGEMKFPRKIAAKCVLFVNPILSFLFVCVFEMNILGVWLAIFLTQLLWMTAGTVKVRQCLKNFSY